MWLKSCNGTLWVLRFCRPTYILALLPAKIIKTQCFHNEHHSNHFLLKNFYGYKKNYHILVYFVQERCWLKSSVTILNHLSLWVHYGKWSLQWLKSLHGCLVSMVLWLYSVWKVVIRNEPSKIYTPWSFHWYVTHICVNIIGSVLRL